MSILQFSEQLQLIFHNLNVNTDKQIKQKMAKIFFCKLFRIIKIFFLILLREAILESKLTCYTLVRPFPTLSCFPVFINFFRNNFRYQNKNNVADIISCFVYQLSKKYCVYYVPEHLKYCLQINEYWLNKSAYLNIVLLTCLKVCKDRY